MHLSPDRNSSRARDRSAQYRKFLPDGGGHGHAGSGREWRRENPLQASPAPSRRPPWRAAACPKPTPSLSRPSASLLSFSTRPLPIRSEEHTSELQSLMRISYAVFCLKKKNTKPTTPKQHT